MSQIALMEIEPDPEPPVEEPVTVVKSQPTLIPVPRKREPVPPRDFYLPGDKGDPPRRAGVIQPRRFSPLLAIRAVPGLLAECYNERVPGEFWSRDSDAAGELAIVSCPCGREPEVPLSHTAECPCGRFYLNVGDRVLLASA